MRRAFRRSVLPALMSLAILGGMLAGGATGGCRRPSCAQPTCGSPTAPGTRTIASNSPGTLPACPPQRSTFASARRAGKWSSPRPASRLKPCRLASPAVPGEYTVDLWLEGPGGRWAGRKGRSCASTTCGRGAGPCRGSRSWAGSFGPRPRLGSPRAIRASQSPSPASRGYAVSVDWTHRAARAPGRIDAPEAETDLQGGPTGRSRLESKAASKGRASCARLRCRGPG